MSLQFEIRDQNDNGDGMSVKSNAAKVNVTEADKNYHTKQIGERRRAPI